LKHNTSRNRRASIHQKRSFSARQPDPAKTGFGCPDSHTFLAQPTVMISLDRIHPPATKNEAPEANWQNVWEKAMAGKFFEVPNLQN
jgi:hypothetical protein